MSNITSKFLSSHKPLLSGLLFVMLLSFTLSNHALADNSQQQADKTQQQIDNLNQKIENLEHQKDNLDTQTDLFNQRVETIKDDLDNRFKEKSLELDKTIKYSWTAIFVVMIGGVIGLFHIFSNLKKHIEKRAKEIADEKVEEEVSKQIEVNKNQLEHLIDAHNLEKTLRKEKHILAIVETEEDKEGLEDFFKKVGIDRVSYRVNEPYSSPESDIDLVLFDDHHDKKDKHDLFKQYMENSASSDRLVFIFYGVWLDYSKEYVNFANSKFTLYNQIINSLTYQHLIQKNANV